MRIIDCFISRRAYFTAANCDCGKRRRDYFRYYTTNQGVDECKENGKLKRRLPSSSDIMKSYGRIAAYVPKELAAAFKEKCARTGISQAQIIKRAIEEFLEQNTGED